MPTIDLAFELVGTTIPLDHGYALFAALSRIVPGLHGQRSVGVHPIRGRRAAPGVLALLPGLRLRLRLPSEAIAPYLAIAGAALDLQGCRLRVGVPRAESLVPAVTLASRMVTFRGALDPESLLSMARRDLSALAIPAEPRLVPSPRPEDEGRPLRRALRVKDRRIVGYALRVGGLTAEESLHLQERGLGGRRRFGCGVFVPAPEV